MDAIVNHQRLHFTVHGDGGREILLLVPGNGCSASTWAPELIDHLADRGFTVITYDPRDTGTSGVTADDEIYTLWDLADDAAGLIEHVTAGQPIAVLGHSMGAAVAQILAVSRPDLVARLVLLGGPARPGRGFEAGPEGLATFTLDWDDHSAAVAALVRSIGEHDADDAAWVHDLFASRSLPMTARSVRRHGEAAVRTEPPTDEQLADVRVPVLVIAGTQDLTVPPTNAVTIAHDHPTAQLELVPGMGHWPARRHLGALAALIEGHRSSAPCAVVLYADPACAWSQAAKRWLTAVTDVRPVTMTLRPYSLLLRDSDDGMPEAKLMRRQATLRALRVLEAVRQEHPDSVPAVWDRIVAQDGSAPFSDLERAVVEAAGDAASAAAADDERFDETIRASMADADLVAGHRVLPPALVIDGHVAFTGPLPRDSVDGPAAGRLWDAIVALAETPGFYELSRTRPEHPRVPGLPSTDQPPLLAIGRR